MRINRYLAAATGISRRAADKAISSGRVMINGIVADLGADVKDTDSVTLDGRAITPEVKMLTLLLNKPVGYVCSRRGQGSKTIYELLPEKYHRLKPVGRLDKDSSGLLLLTNDGSLANKLTHPKYEKEKIYTVQLDQELTPGDRETITGQGVHLPDGNSKLKLRPLDSRDTVWEVRMSEGRNRQIRRTFAALGYKVTDLHRTHFGEYTLGNLTPGTFEVFNP